MRGSGRRAAAPPVRAVLPAVAVLTAVTVLITGCTHSIQGFPAADPVAASAMATTATASTVTAGTTTATRVNTTSTAAPQDSVVDGVPVAAIAAALQDDPVYIDDDVRAAAGADALAKLRSLVTAAREADLNIFVVLIGHQVAAVTDVSDAIARDTGGTAVVVTTRHLAVSSRRFSSAQLNEANGIAESAASPVQAASVLVEQFLAMVGGMPDSSGSAAPTT